jgi:hypothetical protein
MTHPTTNLGTPVPRYGFHGHIEQLNGRVAMLAFIGLLLIEWKLGHGILIWP